MIFQAAKQYFSESYMMALILNLRLRRRWRLAHGAGGATFLGFILLGLFCRSILVVGVKRDGFHGIKVRVGLDACLSAPAMVPA